MHQSHPKRIRKTVSRRGPAAQSRQVLLPGSVIGVLGSGQLGRMFALAARELGYRIHVYSPETDSPAGQIGDQEFAFPFEDLDQIQRFAQGVDVITFEFENVPVGAAAAAAKIVPVRPAGEILHVTQHRLREKTFLREKKFPVTPFRRVTSLQELRAASGEVGLPAVLKTASFGYDGKGQLKISAADQLVPAWKTIQGVEGILEGWVDFEMELSVVGVRSLHGKCATYPVLQNSHVHHILDITSAPADIAARVAREARELAVEILEALQVVGVLTVELFLTRQGKLLINELAPRPHNSGHLTIDACVSSQFEQQVRAVCGLPLGSTELVRPAAMANLLGQLWDQAVPNWKAALAVDPKVKLHLYGKTQPRPWRKMGHLTATAANVEEAVQLVRKARAALAGHKELVPSSE